MTEESEARWDPPPTEPHLVASSLEAIFLDEEDRALLAKELRRRRRRAPIGFAPPPVSISPPSHRRTPCTRQAPDAPRATERATT